MDYYQRDQYRRQHRGGFDDRRPSHHTDEVDDDYSRGSSGASRRRDAPRPPPDGYYHRAAPDSGPDDYQLRRRRFEPPGGADYRPDPPRGRGRYGYDDLETGGGGGDRYDRYGDARLTGYRFDDRQPPARYQQQVFASSHRLPVAYYPPNVSHQPSMPVSAYEPILCPRYNWSLPDCRESGCKLLHICRSWLGGECTKSECRLSHSLADEHNWPKFLGWLTEQERSEMVPARDSVATNHRLRTWLFDKLPKVCPSSLVPRLVCNSPRCRDLHVCVNIVKTGQCRYRQHCASPYHSLFTQRNMEVLRQHYPSIAAHVDPTRPLEEQAWLSDVLKNDMDKPAPAGFDEHHFKLRGLTIDTVQLCVNYGEGRGECQSPGCRDLHVCRAWLGGACPNGRSCRWVHGFTRDVMLRLEPLAEGRPLTCQYNIRDNLKVVFPCTCCYYNTERGCQRGFNNCDYLHLCNAYLRGNTDCRCQRNHDPYDMSVPHRLSRKGVNVSEKDQRVLLRNVLYADLRLKRPCPVCSGGRGSASSSSASRSRSGSRRRDRESREDRKRKRKSATTPPQPQSPTVNEDDDTEVLPSGESDSDRSDRSSGDRKKQRHRKRKTGRLGRSRSRSQSRSPRRSPKRRHGRSHSSSRNGSTRRSDLDEG